MIQCEKCGKWYESSTLGETACWGCRNPLQGSGLQGPTQFMQATMAEQADEIEKLRAIISACHEALGEDPASDDETLPGGIRLHLEGHAEIVGRLKEMTASAEESNRVACEAIAKCTEAEKERDEAKAKLRIAETFARDDGLPKIRLATISVPPPQSQG